MDTEEEYYDVVISGISGKFPASDDVEILKKNLLEKQRLVKDEDCRWNKGKHFLQNYVFCVISRAF